MFSWCLKNQLKINYILVEIVEKCIFIKYSLADV